MLNLNWKSAWIVRNGNGNGLWRRSDAGAALIEDVGQARRDRKSRQGAGWAGGGRGGCAVVRAVRAHVGNGARGEGTNRGTSRNTKATQEKKKREKGSDLQKLASW